MSVADTYIIAAHADTLVAALLMSGDDRRVAWAALTADDKAIALRRATADIDAVRWIGYPADAEQPLAWPRMERRPGNSVERVFSDPTTSGAGTYIDPDPEPVGTEPVTSTPRPLKSACAIQAAHHALLARGVGAARRLEEAAGRGVLSMSGAGWSETIDPRTALDAWARITPEAQRLLRIYRLRGGGVEVA